MTVMNTTYCSIDEAWGDLTGNAKKQNRKKKTSFPQQEEALIQDPICDLYEARANASAYNAETDLVRFANEYYDKSAYQRTNRTQSMAHEDVVREPSPKSIMVSGEKALFEGQFEAKLPPMHNNSASMETYAEEEQRPKYKPSRSFATTSEETVAPEQTRRRYYNEEEQHHSTYPPLQESYSKQSTTLHILDIILYVISGIILIFLLEQFVKIGMYMQRY